MRIDDKNLNFEALENMLSESENDDTSSSITLEKFE